MSEIEELVCIEASVTRKSTSNTVEIRESRRNKFTLGSSDSPAFPTPHLFLKNIVSFDEQSMYNLLYPRLQDPNLCSILSFKIAFEAKRVPGPLYISYDVTLTPQIFEEPDMETCGLCLLEEQHLFDMPNCAHVFHGDCIDKWLSTSNNCPLCGVEIMDDDE